MAQAELAPELRQKVGASDLVQETLIEARRDFAQFAGATESQLKAWLRQILRNNAANLRRRYLHTQKRNGHEVPLTADDSQAPARELVDPSATPLARAMSREQQELVDALLARLPVIDQEVIRLRFAEGLSFVEIAARTNSTDEAVRKRFVRAIEKLSQGLAEESK
jgi:RNA polymerase sigma-70 factor (ECF subfamily)